eukprot:GHVU01201208.1.p1 GENE.GHVU01201208.1~~GHVU01201208.1.p1  ORF type:complete len:180 (-),score=36.41 GHVU01201208.1:318-857(-)
MCAARMQRYIYRERGVRGARMHCGDGRMPQCRRAVNAVWGAWRLWGRRPGGIQRRADRQTDRQLHPRTRGAYCDDYSSSYRQAATLAGRGDKQPTGRGGNGMPGGRENDPPGGGGGTTATAAEGGGTGRAAAAEGGGPVGQQQQQQQEQEGYRWGGATRRGQNVGAGGGRVVATASDGG